MTIHTTKLKRLNDSTYQLPVNAGDVISISYGDGTLMPNSYYTFLAPRLIKLGCPLDSSLFSCLNATYTTPKTGCGCNDCEPKKCGCSQDGCGGALCK